MSSNGIDAENRADYMQGTRVSFRSKEDAMHFAEKQGMFSTYVTQVRFLIALHTFQDGIIMCR